MVLLTLSGKTNKWKAFMKTMTKLFLIELQININDLKIAQLRELNINCVLDFWKHNRCLKVHSWKLVDVANFPSCVCTNLVRFDRGNPTLRLISWLTSTLLWRTINGGGSLCTSFRNEIFSVHFSVEPRRIPIQIYQFNGVSSRARSPLKLFRKQIHYLRHWLFDVKTMKHLVTNFLYWNTSLYLRHWTAKLIIQSLKLH